MDIDSSVEKIYLQDKSLFKGEHYEIAPSTRSKSKKKYKRNRSNRDGGDNRQSSIGIHFKNNKMLWLIGGAVVIVGAYFTYKKFIAKKQQTAKRIGINGGHSYITVASGSPDTPISEWTLSNAIQIENQGVDYFALCSTDGTFDIIPAASVTGARDTSPRISHLVPNAGGEVIVLADGGIYNDIQNVESILLKSPNGDHFKVTIDPQQGVFLVQLANGQTHQTSTIQYANRHGITACSLSPSGQQQQQSMAGGYPSSPYTAAPSTPNPISSPSAWQQTTPMDDNGVDFNIGSTSGSSMVDGMGPTVHVPPVIDEMIREQTRSNRGSNAVSGGSTVDDETWELPNYSDSNHGPDLHKGIFD